MATLAEGAPTIEGYLDLFQTRFPSITLREEARRRMRNLTSLGLAEVLDGRVVLTTTGKLILDERSLSAVQDAFMRRIAGAAEIRELAVSTPLPTLRAEVRNHPPSGLSPTQGSLVLRWLEQLELV